MRREPCVFALLPVSLHPSRVPPILEHAHAIVAFLPAHPEGDAEGGRDRVASADAARRHAAAGGRRHLCLVAARAAGPAQDRNDRARGTEPRRRHRTFDADPATGRSVAGERPLRRLRSGDAAHHRSPQARIAVWADQRGNDHRDLPQLRALLQKPAAQSLPHPVEVSRRAASAVWRDARPRIPDEGRLFVRYRRGRGAARLQPDVRGLLAHLRPHGPEGDPDAGRDRSDRRRPQPRIHRARRDRRIRRVLRQRCAQPAGAGRRCRLRWRSGADHPAMDLGLCRHRGRSRRRAVRPRGTRRAAGFTPAVSRSGRSSTSAPNIRIP